MSTNQKKLQIKYLPLSTQAILPTSKYNWSLQKRIFFKTTTVHINQIFSSSSAQLSGSSWERTNNLWFLILSNEFHAWEAEGLNHLLTSIVGTPQKMCNRHDTGWKTFQYNSGCYINLKKKKIITMMMICSKRPSIATLFFE